MLHLKTAGAEGYEEAIEQFFSTAFPVVGTENKSTVLENVMTALLTTGQLRYGPIPKPEKLVAMREVVRNRINENAPIPILVPFGSRKSVIGEPIDVAEVMALKQLAAVQDRVKAYYEPGIQMVIRMEDLTGDYMFNFEPGAKESLVASAKYCEDFLQLAWVLGLARIGTFMIVRKESSMTNISTLSAKVHEIYPALLTYIERSEGVEDSITLTQLHSWEGLQKLGWQGQISKAQRQYYYDRYTNLDPGITKEESRKRLARYFACSWARIQLGAIGDLESWNGQFLKLTFCPPIPGTPEGMFDRTLYYRTLAMRHAQTHIPPWRAKGYLLIDKVPCPKLASWRENKQYVPTSINFSDSGVSVNVRTDFVIP